MQAVRRVIRRWGMAADDRLERCAAWRQKPASAAQLKMLYQLKGVEFDGETSSPKEIRLMGRTVPVNKITSGMVNSYLVASKRGAFVSDLGCAYADGRLRRRPFCRTRRRKRQGD